MWLEIQSAFKRLRRLLLTDWQVVPLSTRVAPAQARQFCLVPPLHSAQPPAHFWQAVALALKYSPDPHWVDMQVPFTTSKLGEAQDSHSLKPGPPHVLQLAWQGEHFVWAVSVQGSCRYSPSLHC